MKKAEHGALTAALALLVLLLSPATPAWSSATTQNDPAAPDTANTLYQVRDGDAAYVAPTNGYDDGGVTAYCLLTQDASKAALTSLVAPNGNTYPLTSVYVGNALSAAAGCIDANMTLFVDPGTYSSDLDYYRLTRQNFSLVGLGLGGGDPSVILVRTNSTGNDGTVDRYHFVGTEEAPKTDIYIGNVILDFASKDLRNNKTYGYYAVNVGAWTDGFVMNDVIIQNVGAPNSASLYNSALNIFYANTGTHHFVDVTVRNMKTGRFAGVGVVFTNQSTGVYFYDLTVDVSQTNSGLYGVRVENSNTDNLPLTDNMAVFAGDTQVSTGFIQVQDYRYDLIGIPGDYRYVQYTTNNGSNNGNYPAYRVYKTLPAPAANTAILDRADGYWVVRQGQSRTVTQQLSDIATVRNYVASKLSSTPARIPAANIKLAVASPAEVASITTVANFGAGVPVNLVAVPTVTALGTSTAPVPVAAGFSASLGSTANSANVALYNFDFDAIAKYTLAEAIAGINPAAITATDPRDGTYPHGLNLADYKPASTVAARITASSPVLSSQLRNGTFVALASGEPGSVTALNLAIAKSSIGLDTTTTAVATAPAWYTAATAPAVAGTASADDPSVAYFSSDPTIATVDSDTGVITAVGVGTATIYAKAKDGLNNGEIEKPFASTTVQVSSEPRLTLAKSADPLTADVAGTEVDYHFLVSNTGNVRLTGVALSDPTASGLSCPGTALEPTESMQCSATYVLTQADVDAGRAHNDAAVSGSPRVGDPVTATDTLDVAIPARAAVDVSAGTAHFPPGLPSPLTYDFSVTNSGNVTLTDVTISDPLLTSASCPQTVLVPGQTMACAAVYALPQSVIDAGHADLNLIASGTAPSGVVVTATDSLEVSIPAQASIAISAGTAHFPPGLPSPLTYDFSVTNSGNVTLTHVTISDPLLTSASCPQTVLAPGQTMACAAVYALPQSVIATGHADLNLHASGTAPSGDPVTANAQDVVAIPASAEIEPPSSTSDHSSTHPGAVITKAFDGTNPGSVAPSGEDAKASVVPAVGAPETVNDTTAIGDVLASFESDRVVMLPFSLWMLFLAAMRRWLARRRV